jgi:hypothetical protein
MKRNVFLSFCAGMVFKNKICDILTKSLFSLLSLRKNKIPIEINKKVTLIAKIKDHALFDEYFPILSTKFRTQPQWDYNPLKNIIKIELEQEIIEGLCMDYLNVTDIDIPFFETFCELYVYTHYTYDLKKYINVYRPSDIISNSDFVVSETELFKKYRSLICVTFQMDNKQMYITQYFKMFLNNKKNVTLETLLMYNDNIKSFNGSFEIFNNNEITKNFI